MAGLAFVSKLLLVENVFCIFRNFYFLKKKFSYVAVAWAVMELIINVINLYLYVVAFLLTSVNMDTLFVFQFGFLSNANAILGILLGFKNANLFRVLYSEIDVICHDVLKDSSAFQKSLNKAKNFGLILSVIFFCNYMSMLIFYFKNFYVVSRIENPNEYPPAAVLMFLFNTFVTVCSEIRFFIEFVSIIVIISIFGECLKNVHLRISKTVKKLRKGSIEYASINETYQNRNNLNKWFKIFCNLHKCVFYTKKCFAIQVMFSLFTMIIYFIFLLYRGIYAMAQGSEDKIGNQNTLFLLTHYSMVMISTLYAGQKAQNEANSLRRALTQLFNIQVTTPGDEMVELRRLVKNFHRFVTIEPFRVELTSTVFIHMPLLPIILTAIISQTIILLQFNHVV